MKSFSIHCSIYLVLSLFFAKPIHSVAVCVGLECSQISEESLLTANLVNPVLGEVYTKDFLSSMAESAFLQNANSSLMGGTPLKGNRLGLGYGIARSTANPNSFILQETELRELPTKGIATTPTLSYALSLDRIFGEGKGFHKWNVYMQFFPYSLSETNLPFLNIRNTEVSGKIQNFSLIARYFPFLKEQRTDSLKAPGTWDNLSFGMGVLWTSQEIYLNTYDRTTSQFRIDGDRRRWLGINELSYQSQIASLSTDIRHALSWGGFSFFGGLGLLANQGTNTVQAERYAIISAVANRNDFTTNPSAVGIELSKNQTIANVNGYGILGIQLRWENLGLGIEYFKNYRTESLQVGMHLFF